MGRKEERRDNKREIKEEGIGGYGERRGTGAPPLRFKARFTPLR